MIEMDSLNAVTMFTVELSTGTVVGLPIGKLTGPLGTNGRRELHFIAPRDGTVARISGLDARGNWVWRWTPPEGYDCEMKLGEPFRLYLQMGQEL